MHNASLKWISLQVHYMQQPDKTGSKLDFVHCPVVTFHVAIQCSQACSSHTVCTKTMEFSLADSGSTGLERKVLDILCYLYTTMMFTMNDVANLEIQMESRFCDVHFVRLKMDDDKSDLILTLLLESQGRTQSAIQTHSLLNCNVENLKYLKERMQTA